MFSSVQNLFACLLAVTLCAAPAAARTLHVPADSPTIQGALDAAASGDTVWVAPGTYAENISYGGKSIHLESTAGAEATVITGADGAENLVLFSGGEDRRAALVGFTLSSPFEYLDLILVDHATPRIARNLLTGNTIRGDLVAFYASWADTSYFEENITRENAVVPPFRHNVLYFAGGAVVISGNTIKDSLDTGDTGFSLQVGVHARVRNNSIQGPSSAIDVLRDSQAEIDHNLFSDVGWGIWNKFGSAWIHHNLFYDLSTAIDGTSGGTLWVQHNTIDQAYRGLDISDSGGIFRDNTISNCVIGIDVHHDLGIYDRGGNNFWNNTQNYASWAEDEGADTFLPPKFVDPEHGDYRLAIDSPLLDLGRFTGGAQPSGPASDMGAFEWRYPEQSPVTVEARVGSDYRERGESIVYGATFRNDSTEPVSGDAWLELVGKHTARLLGEWRNLTLAPGESWHIKQHDQVPDVAWGGPYRLKARWGRRGESILAADVADVELEFLCFKVFNDDHPENVRSGDPVFYYMDIWNDCAVPHSYDRIEMYASGPADWFYLVRDDDPITVSPESGRGRLVDTTVPASAPPGRYKISTIVYYQGEEQTWSYFYIDVLP